MPEKRQIKLRERLLLWGAGIIISVAAISGYMILLNKERGTDQQNRSTVQKSRETEKDHERNPAENQQGEGQDPGQNQVEQNTSDMSQESKQKNGGKPEEKADQRQEKQDPRKEQQQHRKGKDQFENNRKNTYEERLQFDEKPLIKEGKLKVYRTQQAIAFPATTVQVGEGVWLEVFLCARNGKTHESLFVTEISPKKLHLSLILLGLQTERDQGRKGPQFLGDESVPAGDSVVIIVEWKTESGTYRRLRGERLVRNVIREQSMRETGFVFAGSMWKKTADGQGEIFTANRVKTLVALYHDPTAILDIPIPQGGTDIVYQPNAGLMPERGTEVRMIMRAPSEEEEENMAELRQEARREWKARNENQSKKSKQ